MAENEKRFQGTGRRGMERLSSGWATWRWLSGVSSKERQWFLGTLSGRPGYEAWITHLSKGLQDAEFLLQFETTSDPWDRSRLVGTKISELRTSFRRLNTEQRGELSRQGEVELRTGLEMMGKDKKTIQELLALVDPPSG